MQTNIIEVREDLDFSVVNATEKKQRQLTKTKLNNLKNSLIQKFLKSSFIISDRSFDYVEAFLYNLELIILSLIIIKILNWLSGRNCVITFCTF